MIEKTNSLQSLSDYFKINKNLIIEEFFTFLKFQSVSSEAHYKNQLLSCASWLENYLKQMGFEIERWESKGHPIIFASFMKAGPHKPCLLIYNHYDVQPVDPIENWNTPPFEPTLRDNNVYARGAQDNKGQCFYVLQALKALIDRDGTLPINVKLCIEGEEEMGSESLHSLVNEKQEKLKADYLAIVDVGLRDPTIPAITLGIRGIVTMTIEATGSLSDLHSGSNGGIVYNPLHALVEIFAKARDKAGKVTIPGFYDDVIEMTAEEQSQLTLDFDEMQYKETVGIPSGGEHEYPPHVRAWMRPTLEINGLSGGYTGTGFKTVIPAKAFAKVSCRLVPNQDPKKIGFLVANFFEKEAPLGVKITVKIHQGGGEALRTSPSSKAVEAFAEAASEVFKKPCEYIFCGGSIPIVPQLAKASRSEVVLIGLALDSDLIHAPNEHFGLDRLEKGFLMMARGIELLGQKK